MTQKLSNNELEKAIGGLKEGEKFHSDCFLCKKFSWPDNTKKEDTYKLASCKECKYFKGSSEEFKCDNNGNPTIDIWHEDASNYVIY